MRRTLTLAPAPPPAATTAYAEFATPGGTKPDASDLRVVDGSGNVVGTEILWTGPGDRVSFFFQVTPDGGGTYRAYWGNASPKDVPPTWQRDAGVVLEVRPWKPQAVRDSGEARAALAAAGPVEARVLRRKVFDGLNPGGPSRLYVGTYRGFVRIPPPGGDYDFCTASSDASFVNVDGQPVAAWPGLHGPHMGLHGRFAGRLHLTAGPHRIEYVQYVAGSPPQSAVLGWRRPKDDFYRLIADPDWVQPVPAMAGAAEALGGKALADFAPSSVEHWRTGGEGEGRHLVRMRFEAAAALAGTSRTSASPHTYTWDFGDGRTGTGDRVEHLYVGRGVRTVTLEVAGRDGFSAKSSLRVACDPRWEQPFDVPPGGEARFREALAADVKAGLLPDEVPAALEGALALKDLRLASAVGDAAFACAAKMEPVGRVETFLALAELWSDVSGPDGTRDDAKAQRALYVALEARDVPSALVARAALAAADRAIERIGDPRAGLAILETLSTADLSEDDRRRSSMLRADALASLNRLEDAARIVATLSDNAAWSPKLADAVRASRLHAARARLAAGAAKDAAAELEGLLDDVPRERLRAEGPVLLAEACLKLDEPVRAATLLERALLLEPDGPRAPKALLLLAQARSRLGDDAAARQARPPPPAAVAQPAAAPGGPTHPKPPPP